MFRKTFLHIGAGKTGSTSIQNYCQKHAGLLREDGYFFPPNFGSKTLAAHFFVSSRFHPYPSKLRGNEARRGTKQIERFHRESHRAFMRMKEKVKCDTLILSDELLITLDRSGIERLKRYISSFSEEIQVICYVRHPKSMVSSFVQQGVKNGGFTLENFEDKIQFLRPSSYLSHYIEVFGRDNVIIKEFSRSCLTHGDVVQDFLDILGAERAQGQSKLETSDNEGLCHEALLIANQLSSFARKGARNRGPHEYLARIRGPKYCLPPHKVEELAASEQGELEFLRSSIGLAMHDPELPEPAAPNTLWSDDTVKSIAEVLNEEAWHRRRAEADANMARGELAELKCDRNAARTYYTNALKDIANHRVRFLLSRLCLEEGDLALAEEFIDKALQISPKESDYLHMKEHLKIKRISVSSDVKSG